MLRDSVAFEDINISEERVTQQVEEPDFILTSHEALESQKCLLEIVQAQAREIRALNAKLEALQKDMDTLSENDLCQLRLISQLRESRVKVVQSPLIDELYTLMKALGLKQTTFAGAAKILRVTRGRIHQLKTIIALDQRFIILSSESHKQRLLIRLKDV